MIWKEISCMSCVEYHHHLISSHLFHEATMTNKQPCSRKGLEHTSYNSVNSGSSVLGCGLLNPLPIFPLESVGSPSRAPPASLGLTFRYVQSLGKAARNNQFIWSCDLSITGGDHPCQGNRQWLNTITLVVVSIKGVRCIPWLASRVLIEGLPVLSVLQRIIQLADGRGRLIHLMGLSNPSKLFGSPSYLPKTHHLSELTLVWHQPHHCLLAKGLCGWFTFIRHFFFYSDGIGNVFVLINTPFALLSTINHYCHHQLFVTSDSPLLLTQLLHH